MDRSPPGSSVHGFSGQEYCRGCCALLQGSFLTQGSDLCLLGLLLCRADSLPLSHRGARHIAPVTANTPRNAHVPQMREGHSWCCVALHREWGHRARGSPEHPVSLPPAAPFSAGGVSCGHGVTSLCLWGGHTRELACQSAWYLHCQYLPFTLSGHCVDF